MSKTEVNNKAYDHLGDRWYTAFDDPVAILRSANCVKVPWILERLAPGSDVLDVGCGGGLISNSLCRSGHYVTGLDLSKESLEVARRWDQTGKANYLYGDAYALPFESSSFAAVTLMDFLEHVENPRQVIRECARVLRPGGLLFYSTLNRNFLSWLAGVKLLEWLVRNTPKNMHLHRLFLTPEELSLQLSQEGFRVREQTGLRPQLKTIPPRCLLTGVVPETLKFTLTPSLRLLYMGVAVKKKGEN